MAAGVVISLKAVDCFHGLVQLLACIDFAVFFHTTSLQPLQTFFFNQHLMTLFWGHHFHMLSNVTVKPAF